jgi:hypothetical protein
VTVMTATHSPVRTAEPRRSWTDLGAAMGYTDTAAKRRAILRAAQRLDFTAPYAYWRLQKPHLATVAAAVLDGAQLRRAAMAEVAGHPGWWLLVLDELAGARYALLEFGAEAVSIYDETPPGWPQ